MDISNVIARTSELFSTVSYWCFNHQTEVDIVIPVVVIGSCFLLMRRYRRVRRRIHRVIWGMQMKRKDREKYQNMRLEDCLVDALMELRHEGMMTEEEERNKLIFFADVLGLYGLLPQKDVKKGIKARLKSRFGLKKAVIPGGIKEIVRDKAYDPIAPDPEGLVKSKYVKG